MANDVEVMPDRGELALDRLTADQLIGLVSSRGDDATRGNLLRDVNALVGELAGPSPSALERSLAAVAGTCWLAMRVYEALDLGAQRQGSRSIVQAEFHQRRIDKAHRRYLATLKTLATVRKLAIPAIQVNVGQKQLNVAGGPG